MHAELNTDYEEHVGETIRDNSFAIRAAKAEAIEINTDPKLQDGQPVHWQQLYPMPTPDGMQSTTQVETNPEPVEDSAEGEGADDNPQPSNRINALLGSTN